MSLDDVIKNKHPVSTSQVATTQLSTTQRQDSASSWVTNEVPKSEVIVEISKYYSTLFLTPKINNLKSTFFGDISTYITKFYNKYS